MRMALLMIHGYNNRANLALLLVIFGIFWPDKVGRIAKRGGEIFVF